MIEKLKYHFTCAVCGRKMRVACAAVLTALTIAVVTLLSCSTKTIIVSDGELTYTVHTVGSNIASVVSGLKLKSDSYNIIDAGVKNGVKMLRIEYTFPVYITVGSETKTIEFAGGTVKDALGAVGIEPDENDMVEPSLDTVISDTVYIDYVDVEYVSGTYSETIPYSLDVVYSDSYAAGTTTVSEGTNGLQNVSYTSKLVNGTAVETTITQVDVLSQAVNGIKTVGTKAVSLPVKSSSQVNSVSTLTPSVDIQLDANGNPVNYKSKMVSRATAYTYTGHNCETGVAPQPGYIAVNPNVIPYGTKMYIKTADGSYIYGYAVAADTGGFIKKHPTGVDLFMATKSACTAFGVRNVEIYILE